MYIEHQTRKTHDKDTLAIRTIQIVYQHCDPRLALQAFPGHRDETGHAIAKLDINSPNVSQRDAENPTRTNHGICSCGSVATLDLGEGAGGRMESAAEKQDKATRENDDDSG